MPGAFSVGKIPPPQERRETAHTVGSASHLSISEIVTSPRARL
jgi:hypothetical protein